MAAPDGDGSVLPERPAAHVDGWYVQHLPHWFQAATVVATLVMELVLVWMLFLPRHWRIVCFFIVTRGRCVILTANYAFLNYMVLALGFLLLDDRFLMRFVPCDGGSAFPKTTARSRETRTVRISVIATETELLRSLGGFIGIPDLLRWPSPPSCSAGFSMRPRCRCCRCSGAAFRCRHAGDVHSQPFRIANHYGLFAVMTRDRYEIEFQGSNDGQNWIAYPFRYKPQDLHKAPGIYAPYQPRFEWNLWFASLGSWTPVSDRANAEVLLLKNDPDVLSLFAGQSISGQASAPGSCGAVAILVHHHGGEARLGIWWRRELLGLYAPTLRVGAGWDNRAWSKQPNDGSAAGN